MSREYGFNLFGVDDFTAGVLLDCLETAQHWRLLHDPHLLGSLDMEAVLKLAQRAGYPEEIAQKVACEHGYQRICKDLPP